MPYKDPCCQAAIESQKRRYKKWYNKRNDKYRLQRNIGQKDYYYRLGQESAQKRRLEVLTHYGGNPPKCVCCGEPIIEFLTVDHINGGGEKHRKQIRSKNGKKTNFYRWLIDNNFPEGYQVMCSNCNMAKGRSKTVHCPVHHPEEY